MWSVDWDSLRIAIVDVPIYGMHINDTHVPANDGIQDKNEHPDVEFDLVSFI
jgi:hypothetical protein